MAWNTTPNEFLALRVPKTNYATNRMRKSESMVPIGGFASPYLQWPFGGYTPQSENIHGSRPRLIPNHIIIQDSSFNIPSGKLT